MFIKKFGDGVFIVLLFYVDAMLIVGHDRTKIDKLKENLSKSFCYKGFGTGKINLEKVHTV